ncbi:MAG TPA: M28 family peptidase, partial [Verrucomicrobiae bacterium]|nr:M28 family peptidase [Verrucomicrobiae bacterium]
TECYPELQSRIRGLGVDANMRILPLGSDLIGPRSDHVAFESRGVPCLFFSCGTFKDYHSPGDTAAALNYGSLTRAAQVLLGTVEGLANGKAPPRIETGCDPEELKSARTVVTELEWEPLKAGIKTNDLGALHRLKRRIDELSNTGRYTPRTRELLLLDVAQSLGRYLLPFGDQGSAAAQTGAWSYAIPYLEHIYLKYHRDLIEAQRRLIAQVLKHPPNLVRGISPFRYELYDIPADDVSLEPLGNGRFALHALGNDFSLFVKGRPLIWLFGAFQITFSGSFEALDCEGTRQELIDYCFLYFHDGRTNEVQSPAFRQLLSATAGTNCQGNYPELLQAQLVSAGFAGETDWLLACLASTNTAVQHEALAVARTSYVPRVRASVREMILKPKLASAVRAQALQVAETHPDKATLLIFAEAVTDERAAFSRDDCAQFQPGYPLADRPVFHALRPLMENTFAQPTKSIGEMAVDALKKATRQNFGTNAGKWKAYVERTR